MTFSRKLSTWEVSLNLICYMYKVQSIFVSNSKFHQLKTAALWHHVFFKFLGMSQYRAILKVYLIYRKFSVLELLTHLIKTYNFAQNCDSLLQNNYVDIENSIYKSINAKYADYIQLYLSFSWYIHYIVIQQAFLVSHIFLSGSLWDSKNGHMIHHQSHY